MSNENTVCGIEMKMNESNLIPVIVQDYESGEVLMLAYSDAEALKRTIETGRMWYYSRSRNEYWCKGETSGNRQYLRELRYDCDKDTVLAKVLQIGPACHTGERTCFSREFEFYKKDLNP